MAVLKTNASTEQGKKESVYPLYPLDEAIKIAEAVKDMGGSRSSVSKALLAKHMHYAETGPSFVQRIASAKTYGLIDGWGAYGLTDSAKRYFYPTNDTEKQNASLHFLSTPSAFKLLIERFDGERLPPNEMLGNVLHQEAKVPTSWKDRLASMFVRGAQSIGIIDAEGILRYGANMHNFSPAETAREHPGDVPKIKVDAGAATSEAPERSGPGQTVWAFRHKSGERIRLETPEDMTRELWEKLNAYVQILKPSDSDGKII
ncbi:MAG TPA: hypothetical protein VH619_02395 [Verrucomicrobiae bacterium]|jgi:hypothetical protein|nr:hypothetical protein [Verrucomicrobiae bacterium]